MKKIGFLSHLDENLYLFRLPIMKELVKNGYEVYAITPRGKFFDKFTTHNIQAIEYKINRKSLNPIEAIKSIYQISNILKTLHLDILNSFTIKPNIFSACSLILSKEKTSLICAITGLGSFYIENSFKSNIIKTIIENLYKLIFLKAKKVIFQNSDDMSLYIKKKCCK